MREPHKHAAVIKAWADGKAIQFGHLLAPTAQDPLARREVCWNDFDFGDSFSPAFCAPQLLWRVKPEPLEWQVERDAFARGEKIEVRWNDPLGKGLFWIEAPIPNWLPASHGYEYRIKPKPHKWQAEMDAQDRGEVIEVSTDRGNTWCASGVGGGWRFDDHGMMYRVKPKTVKTRIRVAGMDSADGSGKAWTRSVYTDDQAAQTERRADFLCWLHDWKEIERPAAPIAGSDVLRAFEKAFSGALTSGQGWFSVRAINPEMKGDFA